MQPLYGVRILL